MTHRCFCGSTGESTRCSTFWLWSEVRAWPLPNLSLYPQTYTSACWNGKNWLYYPKLEYHFDSKVVLIDHSTICFFFHSVVDIMSFDAFGVSRRRKKKNITGVTVLPLEWVGLFAWHVAVNRVSLSAPRVNTPAFTSSLALIISLCPLRGTEEHTHVLCLFAIAEVFMVTTQTLVLKEARPPAFQWAEMNRTRTCERENRRKVCCSATNQFRGTLTTRRLLTKHSSFFSLVFFQGCSRAGRRNRLPLKPAHPSHLKVSCRDPENASCVSLAWWISGLKKTEGLYCY